MKPAPAVSVVVPCRNERTAIRESLTSIASLMPPEGDFEIVVADGMSEDGTTQILAELAARFPIIRVIPNPGLSVSAGLNRAIRAAQARVVIRMDAHTRYAPDYLLACLRTKKATGAANVGGPWRALGKGVIGEAIAASFHSPFSTGGGGAHDLHYEGKVDTVYLGCWDRDFFETYGYFDEELVRNQDDELNLRVTRKGGVVWQSPDIRCEYECRASLAKLAKQFYQYGYWKVRVIQKHRLPASIRHLAPAMAMSFITVATLASLLSSSAEQVAATCWLAYLTAIILEGLRLAASHRWRLWPVITATFPCYHFGYAVGFLHGLWDFSVLRRPARLAATNLTR
jgi:succinoglycan biosynthesis protein ExoA